MKKLLFLLLALPLMLVSCHDDNDYPNVRVGVDYSGATNSQGTLYLVQGDTLNVDSVFVTPVDPTKPAVISSVTYVLNGTPLGVAPTSPYSLSILTAPLQPGKYTLRLQMGVFQNGKTPGIAYVYLPFEVVESSADIPAGPDAKTGRISSTPDVDAK